MAQSLSSAAEKTPILNSGARADLIRSAVRWIAEREAEVKTLNTEIREYKATHIKGDLGFKLADWNAVYRVSQLDVEDRDALLDTVREGFQALGIGGIVDWVAAVEGEPQPEPRRRRRVASRDVAPINEAIFAVGREDALEGHMDRAEHWPAGEVGHADYHLGHAAGERERDRVNGVEAPKRRRGRPPRKPRMEDAGAEA
jgi:hypothetical protein